MILDDRTVRITTDVTLGIGAIAYPFMDIDLTSVLHIAAGLGGVALVWLRVCITVRELREKRRRKRETLDT